MKQSEKCEWMRNEALPLWQPYKTLKEKPDCFQRHATILGTNLHKPTHFLT